MEIKEHMQDFLLSGRQGGWSAATVKTYTWHLDRFTAWLDDGAGFDDLTPRVLRSYSASTRDWWAPATCKTAVVVIRSLLSWAADEDLCDRDLVKVLRLPKVPTRIQRTVTADEVGRLLATCERPYTSGLSDSQGHAANLRNRAIVALLFDSFMRAGELCNLRVADVDVEKRTVIVHNGKGGKDRMARFSTATVPLVEAWLKLRPFVASAECDHFFVGITGNTPGERLTTNGLRVILRRLGSRAGIPHLSPHSFRRGAAVQAIRNGASSRTVQNWGGWAHMNMIETYTRAFDGAELYDQYPPMGAVDVEPVDVPETLQTQGAAPTS